MTGLLVVFCGLVGLAVGSFLTVVTSRLPAGESVVAPRSRCPGCGTQVRPRDNVPVASWLLLRGRCRGCAEPISVRYPLTEAGTAGLFVLLGLRLGPSVVLPAYLYLAAVGVALAVIDLATHTLPDVLTYPSYLVGFALLGLASVVRDDPAALLRGGLGMAAGYAVYLLLALARPGGMGFGDVKLGGVLGLFTGWLGWGSWAVGLLLAFVLGGLVSVALLATGRATRTTRVPFGPFMIVGALMAVVGGQPLVSLWLSAGS